MAEEPKSEAVVDPEPEGVIEIPRGEVKEKVVPLAALTAERERIRKQAEEKHKSELEPLKIELEQRRQRDADLELLKPQLEHLQRHPELLEADKPPAVRAVSDEDAEKYARRYELYTPQGGLNLAKAKEAIADNRAEMSRVAIEAAKEAVKPVAAVTAEQNSKANFLWAAQQRDPGGRPLVDPQILAEQWAKVPHELSAQPDVARHILQAAIGAMYLAGKQPPTAPSHEPVFSEAPGGRQRGYQMSEMERTMAQTTGLSESDWAKTAQRYKPGQVNVLGE